jgi:hypothetical protein
VRELGEELDLELTEKDLKFATVFDNPRVIAHNAHYI